MANTAVLVVSFLLLVVVLLVAKSRIVDYLDDDSVSFNGVFRLSCPTNWECCRTGRSPHLAGCCPPESQCITEDKVPNCRYGPRFPELEDLRGTATGQLGMASSEVNPAGSSTLERGAVGNGTSMAAVSPEASP
mmetsp:Transcript_41812/g.119580  ORF Transcript_41812/g.119580 Transcript_41812/m.119580 type:complete len:134 (+) Transcript_41812:64-465(+)